MSLMLTEKDLQNEDELSKKLITLAEIVFRKHFYASSEEKEDLVSVGVLKAVKMINDNIFDKSKGNFATLIYTGMRNDMHNYLYHKNKFDLISLDCLLEEGKDDTYFERDIIALDYSIVHNVCLFFIKNFGDIIEERVISILEDIGFEIIFTDDMKNYRDNNYVCSNDILTETYGKSVSEDMANRIVGLILWKISENSLYA